MFSVKVNIEQEKNYREEILKNQQGSELFEESLGNNELQEEEMIIKAEVPKDVQNLKSQYEVLVGKFQQKELALKDAENEHNDEKFDLIDQIREQRKDVQF